MSNKLDNKIFGESIFLGLKDKVQEMINLGIELNPMGSTTMTPLIMAIEGDQPQILELLLQNGANPNLQSDSDGFTPLHWAVEYALDGMIQNNRKNKNGDAFR